MGGGPRYRETGKNSKKQKSDPKTVFWDMKKAREVTTSEEKKSRKPTSKGPKVD